MARHQILCNDLGRRLKHLWLPYQPRWPDFFWASLHFKAASAANIRAIKSNFLVLRYLSTRQPGHLAFSRHYIASRLHLRPLLSPLAKPNSQKAWSGSWRSTRRTPGSTSVGWQNNHPNDTSPYFSDLPGLSSQDKWQPRGLQDSEETGVG